MSLTSASKLSRWRCLAAVAIVTICSLVSCRVKCHPPPNNPTIAPDVIDVTSWSHDQDNADGVEELHQQHRRPQEHHGTITSRADGPDLDKILAMDRCQQLSSKRWLETNDHKLKDNEFPSFVELRTNEKGASRCAGTLVGERVVITSADCLEGPTTYYKVRMALNGDHYSRDIKKTCIVRDEGDPVDVHNIGVVILKDGAHFQDNVRPACLSNWIEHSQNGDYVTISESVLQGQPPGMTSVVWLRMAYHRESRRNKTIDMHIDSSHEYPNKVCPITRKMDWSGQPLFRIEDNKPYLVGVAKSHTPKKDVCDIEDNRRRRDLSGARKRHLAFSHVHWLYSNLLDESGKHLMRTIKECYRLADA